MWLWNSIAQLVPIALCVHDYVRLGLEANGWAQGGGEGDCAASAVRQLSRTDLSGRDLLQWLLLAFGNFVPYMGPHTEPPAEHHWLSIARWGRRGWSTSPSDATWLSVPKAAESLPTTQRRALVTLRCWFVPAGQATGAQLALCFSLACPKMLAVL